MGLYDIRLLSEIVPIRQITFAALGYKELLRPPRHLSILSRQKLKMNR
jgi:hypothetical protein